ncbi:nucleotidyltransferase [Bacillus aquiflavi]|uniref:tRNA(Met) cytidine acetate ligase n=1 Tax=Bacillus aquiflavi TaxID=2672567 RepID=A0A6B3W058_9BACI|nr:nucleotidyltransferase [Bacillus aquiflavi]MBA4537630.1 nucleotidyltransferase [Bacillus aquiflavi]NEY81887.1 nucleotidyltransferase [Bacillus aquiflavi]UAC49291.1 nucleotidyltransferase [Bacillus aquiflavi]
MRAVGVIVEYNPFHNGHAFHLQKAKEATDADIMIAVMSGNFLQRGEPALVSKWTRTKMALAAGVDIVFELPYPFATQKADTFANGAVSILTAAMCHSLCFGSEDGDVSAFHATDYFLKKHDHQLQIKIKQHMKAGVSYPKAVANALQTISTNEKLIDLSKPNNMLGYQYVSAVQEQKSSMHICTIKRQNADYHDEQFSSETIASATSIRKALFSKMENTEIIKQYVPISTYHYLMKYKQLYGDFHQWENYWPFLKFKLLQSTAKQLKHIYEMEEGLENRFLSAAEEANSFYQFIEKIKTKRYTWTRLQRASVHLLTNTQKEEMMMHGKTAEYLRLLGFSKNGKTYLNKMKHQFHLPLISKLSSFKSEKIALDIRASKIFALSSRKLLKEEFSHPPIFYDKRTQI